MMQPPAWVFLGCLAFCLYTLAGYPLLLALAARFRGREVHRAPLSPAVSVILPVYNGERWIAAKLESILRLDYPAVLVEILVVSDGSTDATEQMVRRFAGRARLRWIPLPRGGKAAALNAGIGSATGEVLFFTDVRQDLAPDSLARLVECLADPSVGVVSGELVIREGEGTEEANVGLYWKYEKWIRKAQSKIDSVAGATGCIYAMRRELATPLPAGTLNDDMYLPLAAFFRGYRVILEERARAYDFPTQLASEFRRKVRTLAGVYQIVGQYPALLGPRNRMWVHFFSHKLARLLMPWAMLIALAASFGLPAPWRGWTLAAQAAGYGLAAVDLFLPEGTALKRLSSPARTFLTLMAASLCAVSYFFVPAATLWGETRVAGAAKRRDGDAAQS
ncbi:MAG: glycosyltransferase family 2 protein [Acidobacteriota bacterium]|nr:glycosyltransferase family 2 protein [Acidobacteriota bacterium]